MTKNIGKVRFILNIDIQINPVENLNESTDL